MNTQTSTEQTLALAFAAAWNRLERRLDHSLGAIRGISLAEYRLLRALGDAPGSQASRVDLARAVGLTPSGVTRALRPMEKLGIVSTVKSKRDARLAIAALTVAGREVLIPFRRPIVKRVDRAAREIEIEPPDGLLEL